MFDNLKARYFEWYNKRIKIGFYKAWTYILNTLMLFVGVLPVLINLALDNWTSIGSAMPTIAPYKLLMIYMALNVLNLMLAPVKQAPGSVKIATPPPEPPSSPNAGDPGAPG